jgi:hypothetical protein
VSSGTADRTDAGPREGGSRSGERGGKKGKRGGGRGERAMVPPAEFTSYYGRPIVKASPWEHDIPAYLFLGGVAAGSSLLSAGADLTDRPALRRTGRLAALVGLTLSMLALVKDLGRPERFLNMLRVVKVTSPMSVGTWILTAYGPFAGLAAVSELRGLLPRRLRCSLLGRLLGLSGRPAGLVAAAVAPAVASYTAVLLTDTATPTWHAAHRHLPFVFVGSACAASGGLGMIGAPVAEAGPARRLALGGALLELAVERKMEQAMGITASPCTPVTRAADAGQQAADRRRSRRSGAAGGPAAAGRRCCPAPPDGRIGLPAVRVFDAGQASARDPATPSSRSASDWTSVARGPHSSRSRPWR